MPTSTTSPKVQVSNSKVQGPNLRAAIAELPLKGQGLSRERLEDASVGEVVSAISDRLINDRPYVLDVMVWAASSQDDGFVDGVQVGLQVVRDDLADELRQIGWLSWAIGRDEKGMDVPERQR